MILKIKKPFTLWINTVVMILSSLNLLIVALSAEVSELSYIFEEFILTRVNRRFEFQLLEPSESSHFIKEILNSARIDNDNQNDKYKDNDNEPQNEPNLIPT